MMRKIVTRIGRLVALTAYDPVDEAEAVLRSPRGTAYAMTVHARMVMAKEVLDEAEAILHENQGGSA